MPAPRGLVREEGAGPADEQAIRKALPEDSCGLRSPVYFRFILTVDNPAAERFQRLDGTFCDRVLRDAVEKTFRGAARGAQGVFAVHQHGGQGRPAHPRVHALLSPRFENGMAVHLSPVRIQRVKERWEREVLIGLQRQERRLDRARAGLARVPVHRSAERGALQLERLVPFRSRPRRDGQLELFARPRRPVRLGEGHGWVRRWLRFGRRGARWEQEPEKAARPGVFRLATRAMPKPMRDVIALLRGLRALALRQR